MKRDEERAAEMDEKAIKTERQGDQAEQENQGDVLAGYLTLAEIEKDYILATMKKVDGNKARAARLLGISVRNLYRKMEEYS